MSGDSPFADMPSEAFDINAQDGIQEFGSAMQMPMDQKPFKMPTKEELLAMLDSMGLSEQEADELRAALLDDGTGEILSAQSSWTSEALILMAFLVFIASIFVFMFYRIYKSMADKEKMREEKRQQKFEKKQIKKRK